jgi:cation diffusion facilitator CzcD-associated flavoprotein CzcO
VSTDIAAAANEVDLEWVRAKYRAERQKRLHPEGSHQYRRITEELAHYSDDPHTPLVEREPVEDLVDVAVIGGGFGGLLIGARLRQAGVDDIRIVEQGGDFGGTWYWNRYPGAACDTESYIYMPLLEETGFIPTEKYAKGPEILEHARRIARHFDLYRNALLSTAVTDIRWDEVENVWVVSTSRGDRFRARFLAMTTGPMSKPKLPGVPGIEEFEGRAFHTTRWDYDYTGGDSYGNLTGLADKRVAIIGTGATGIQCVPHVAKSAQHLYVFQRTPSAINVRANRPTDPEWVKTLEPGWQRQRMENFSTFVAGGDAESDLVNDGWTAIYRLRSLNNGVLDEREDFVKMEEIRARVDSTVEHQATAEALKPWYRALCKRPCFHDEYLDAYNQPNVTLVDTLGKGIERITRTGVVANGVEHEVDCIIFASGFQMGGALRRRVGYEVLGVGGVSLTERWKDGISTFFGMQTSGFPNFFVVQISQTGVSSNQTHVLDVQSRHIAYVVSEVRSRGAVTVECSDEAEAAWVQECISSSRANIEFLLSCTPGYYNNEGQPTLEGFQRNGAYSPGIVAFDHKLQEWRQNPALPGLVFTHAEELVS